MSRRGAVRAAIAALALLVLVASGYGSEARAARKKKVRVVTTTPARPATAPEGPPASVVVDRVGGARRLAATVQGRILDEAYPRRVDGKRRIVMLVDPPPAAGASPAPVAPAARGGSSMSLSVGSEGSSLDISDAGAGARNFVDSTQPRWLAWLDPAAEGRIEIVRRDIPGDVRAIDAIDRDGDGDEEIALWRPGGIWAAKNGPQGLPDGPIEPLVADSDLDPGPNAARALCAPDCVDERRVWTEVVGSLRAYGSDADGSWSRVVDIPMPVTARKDPQTLLLTSPPVRVLPPGTGGRRLFAIGPEPLGSDRLRTLLVDPAAPADTPPTECWSRLPGPEILIESAFLRIGGKPALVVTTRSSVKLGIFAEKWLRVFVLEEDRTRRGAAPVLALETKMNLWQRTVPMMLDADRDGRADLVLAYWKGLKNGHVEVDAYLQGEDGTFSRSARTTSFEVPEADRSYLDFGRDLDGDGRADLILTAGGKIEIHTASPRSKKGDDLVEPAARFTLPLEADGAIHVNMPAGSGDDGDDVGGDADGDGQGSSPSRPKAVGVPRFIDLDGDGRDEILVVGGGMGDGRLVVFTLPKAAPAP